MMVCMAGLQVFIVRFFFQVCYQFQSILRRGDADLDRERERAMYERVLGEKLWDLGWLGIVGVESFYVILRVQFKIGGIKQ